MDTQKTQQKPRIIVKVGTNVLLQEKGVLDYNTIFDIVSQIVALSKQYSVILVSSGAVSAGKETGKLQGIQDPIVEKQVFASIGQSRLMDIYARFFEQQGKRVAQLLLTKDDFGRKETFYNTLNTLEGIIENQIIPIINENDALSLSGTSFGDNDQLAAFTAIMVQAEKLILLSTISGFFTADPLHNKDAKHIPLVEKITAELRSMCEDSLSSGGTGGMFSKLKAAEMAMSNGVEVVLTKGKEENILIQAVQNKAKGTYFKAVQKNKTDYKVKWMHMPPIIKGTITIDKGAVKALQTNNSLLLVGILKMQGNFEKKDVILIQTEDKIKIATALANYARAELNDFIHNKAKQGIIVVHVNHLYLL